jgi:alpha-tubulin suppressor-like RCC1 family protein
VAGVSGAIQVVAGSLHSCALTSGGETYCWGQNRYGQLGDGSTAARAAAVRVDGAPAFVALTASGAHSCGVTGSGDVYCWGYNLEGQLGDGTRANRSRPVRVRAGA